ncbi:hypothetical protein JCM18694_09220 [Prolixibacter denitrificans]|uniref:SHOCT domain-containing protein n=2 Tax=Prolixibacter denitrificans TaxID=1541063 RepID=A0ABQ0ZGT4_9BACT|nr:hypothetical protein JCM18694_09220 [Prolixibacter denitrificans]
MIFLGAIMAGFSKLFNVRVRGRFGSKIADPEDWDMMIDTFKGVGELAKDSAKGTYKKIKAIDLGRTNLKSTDRQNKIDQLQKLADLKNSGAITDEEYNALKKDLLR